MEQLRVLVFIQFLLFIEATKPQSVNVALETVLEFNNKDNSADIQFLDDVQQFIKKVKTVIDRNKPTRRKTAENNIKFTEFIQTAIEILKTYNNDDLEDTVAIFEDEIRKYHYKGCKFNELLENKNVRRFLGNKLNKMKYDTAPTIKKKLTSASQVIENAKYDRKQTEFLNYVNSLYRHDSVDKLKAFLNNLRAYKSKCKRANIDLINVVKNGIRSVIFDHYSNLSENVRRDFKIKLESTWNDIRYPERVKHKVWTEENSEENNSNKINLIDLISRTALKAKTITLSTKDAFKELTTPKYIFKYKHRKEKKDKTESTTPNRMHTWWVEKIKPKKRKHKKDKLNENNKLQSKTGQVRSIISNHAAEVDVMKVENVSSEDEKYLKHRLRHQKAYRNDRKSMKKRHRRHRKQETTTHHNKYRKQLPRFTSPLSEEGISIDDNSFRRSMIKDLNITPDHNEHNVLRRINELEKEIEVVKNKIETKIPNHSKSTETKVTTAFIKKSSPIPKTTKLSELTTAKTTVDITETKTNSDSDITTINLKSVTEKTPDITSITNTNPSIESITDNILLETTTLLNEGNTDPEINKLSSHTLAALDPDYKQEVDDDLDKIMKKYSIDKTETTKADKFLEDSAKINLEMKENDNELNVDDEDKNGALLSKDGDNDPLQDVNALINLA